MGKIKNRDEKRKAAKVFSSGASGGSKGPSVIDKRNQELKCPHCERIFKQSGRLNDHIKKQHGELQPEGDGQPSSGVPEAGNVCISDINKKNEASKASTRKQEVRIMDIGSKNGAYDYKSPKLLLHEMRLKEKLPKARYKSLHEEEDGVSRWRCKVVLPHPKRSEDDVVLFLDRKDAASSEDEAQQRAAVLALHRVAGNLSLERTLPPSYVPLWNELSSKEEERRRRAKHVEEKRAIQQERKARDLKKRGPSTVIMTDDNRKMVEEIIQGARLTEKPSMDNTMYEAESGQIAELVGELESLGFASEDASEAAQKAASLHAALDWLCLNLPESRLPSKFAPGAAGKPITVIRTKHSPDFVFDTNTVDPSVVELMSYGYSHEKCIRALEKTKGDNRKALFKIYSEYCKEWGIHIEPDLYQDTMTIEDCNEALNEELMALEAIFGDDITVQSRFNLIIKQRVVLTQDAAGLLTTLKPDINVDAITVDGLVLTFQFFIPSQKDGIQYPMIPPMVAIECKWLPCEILNAITREAAQKIVENLGQPLIYEVISHVSEVLSEIIQDFVVVEEEDNASRLVDIESASVANEHTMQEPKEILPSQRRQRSTNRNSLSSEELIKESKRLKDWENNLETSKAHSHMRQSRAKLPAASKRADVLHIVSGSQVIVIMGSTGCGKSTQIPQYLLEEYIKRDKGRSCNIICTQPRRISAVGLATRVAAERSEKVGSTVGYSVRLDSKQSKETRILFCTTGVMLRRLLSDPMLNNITHVVLDEVHERTIESDLLLLLLRELLRSGKNKKLKVILMSATADAHTFATYFMDDGKPSPVVSIPGFTHPVRDYFLEDIFELTGYYVGKSSKWARRDSKPSNTDEKSITRFEFEKDKYCEQTLSSLLHVDENMINIDLIEHLVYYLVLNEMNDKDYAADDSRAILIFVPGADSISKIVKCLQTSSRILESGMKLQVLPLHGGLPPSQQNKVFERPRRGVTKVVVSTNVAETSITIDDVTCVIDSGKANEIRFDAIKGISRLQEVFVSQASCQQRRGRAGRVKPGRCFRLFSRATWDKKLDKNTLPEISRSPLHSLVMDTKAITPGDIYHTLSQMLTPPPADGLKQAVTLLERMGALDPNTQLLTPLGMHLTKMPCDPKLGKMLIFGAMLRCLDPVLTIVSAQAFGRPVFWSSPETRTEAETAKLELVGSNKNSKSDHIAIIAAYNGWRAALSSAGRRAASSYCQKYFVSEQAMDSIHSGRRQFADILASLGFIPDSYVHAACKADYVPPTLEKPSDVPAQEFGGPGGVDEFAGHAKVVKAALASGFYPQLVRVENPAAQFTKVQGGAIEIEGSATKVKFFEREKGRVFIHPSSINFPCGKFESGWLVYSDIMQTSKTFVRECSMVSVYAVLLFGGQITVNHEKGLVLVDEWASFKAPARIGVLIRELRQEVSELLGRKIANPKLQISDSRIIEAMHHLLSTDGF